MSIAVKYNKLRSAVKLINKYDQTTPLEEDVSYNPTLESMYIELVREYKAKNVTPVMIAKKYLDSFGVKNDLI